MSLPVTSEDQDYEFDGPFELDVNGAPLKTLKKQSGVYLISTRTNKGKHKYLDVGEAGNVRKRVANHDRSGCWKMHEKNGLYVSAYYCDKASRRALEAELRDNNNLPCGDR